MRYPLDASDTALVAEFLDGVVPVLPNGFGILLKGYQIHAPFLRKTAEKMFFFYIPGIDCVLGKKAISEMRRQ